MSGQPQPALIEQFQDLLRKPAKSYYMYLSFDVDTEVKLR